MFCPPNTAARSARRTGPAAAGSAAWRRQQCRQPAVRRSAARCRPSRRPPGAPARPIAWRSWDHTVSTSVAATGGRPVHTRPSRRSGRSGPPYRSIRRQRHTGGNDCTNRRAPRPAPAPAFGVWPFELLMCSYYSIEDQRRIVLAATVPPTQGPELRRQDEARFASAAHSKCLTTRPFLTLPGYRVLPKAQLPGK